MEIYEINGTEYEIQATASGGYTVTESTSSFDEPETRYFASLEKAYQYILSVYACGEVNEDTL